MTENERVKEVRKTLNLTLEKFGERIGVTRGSMSNIENGNRNLIMAGGNETRKNMIKMLLYASDDDIKAFDRLVDYYISLREEK